MKPQDAQGSKINPYLKTAVIYSLDDLFAYSVEIREGDNSYYVTDSEGPKVFGNLQEARQAAIDEKVVEAFLALSRTYDEASNNMDISTEKDNFDYCPLVL